jgi:hypothetical protein
MKSNLKFNYLLIALCTLCLTFTRCSNSPHAAPDQGAVDTTQKQNHTNDGHTGPGTGGWTFTLIVRDAKAVPISGATVAAPCTGQPNRLTDITGTVQFSGTGSCTCSSSPATVTTTKGCDIKLNVSCDSTYNVTCDQ